MKTDKNTVIGFVLLGILFMGYFWFTSRQQQAVMLEQTRAKDSIERIKAATAVPVDTIAMRLDSIKRDSMGKILAAGKFDSAAIGTEEFTTVENAVMKVTFTNKGGQPKGILLKKYKSYDSTQVVMADSDFDNFSYNINTSPNQSAATGSLFFRPGIVVKNADGSQTVSFTIATRDGESITHQYIVKPADYMLDFNILLNGADKLLTQNALNINWQVLAAQHQSDINYERTQSRLCYVEDGEYDFEHAASGTSKAFETTVKWVSLKQQFFNSTLVAKNNFKSGEMTVVVPNDSSGTTVGRATANLKLDIPAGTSASVPLQ